MPLARFHPVLLDSLADYNRHMLTRDISAGLTVGMVALPLAMAFGIASGVPPEAGLYTAIIAGFLISLFGGCRVQIGGPAGAFVVIIYGIIAQYGISNLMLATIGSGIILFFMGLFKLGGFIKFIPISIVIGFTNGIAVMIGLQQVKDFLGLTIAKMPADFFEMIKTLYAHISTFNPWAFAIAITSFLIIFFWPKGYSMGGPQWKRWLAHLPGTVVVLVLSTLVVTIFNLPVETIGSKFGGIPQGLPSFELPDFDWQTAKQLYGSMLTLAVLGSIESLLCARVADTMTDDRHDPNQELMGQGIANFIVPFFGGIPATGTIARTVTNIKSGAFSPVAGMVHAVTLLARYPRRRSARRQHSALSSGCNSGFRGLEYGQLARIHASKAHVALLQGHIAAHILSHGCLRSYGRRGIRSCRRMHLLPLPYEQHYGSGTRNAAFPHARHRGSLAYPRGTLFRLYLKARTCYGPTPSDRSRFGKDCDPRLHRSHQH